MRGHHTDASKLKMSEAKRGMYRLENHPQWKGGVMHDSQGYRYLKSLSHPFHSKQGYVAEHRLVIESSIGRFLNKDELIHHINGNKLDNRLENLQIVSLSDHRKIEHIKVPRCSKCGRWTTLGNIKHSCKPYWLGKKRSIG